MTAKGKNRMVIGMFLFFLSGMFLWGIFAPDKTVSDSERRLLTDFPELSAREAYSGRFMKRFENYAADQFPIRDSFRALKAASTFYVFHQKDMNGIYMIDGSLSKLEYPMDRDSVKRAAEKFREIYEKYLQDGSAKVYLSVIPDKNYFMAERNGYPAMDYGELVNTLTGRTKYMEYIDIFDCLSLSDYYKTDTHWRQEKIVGVARKLASCMHVSVSDTYQIKTWDGLFYGVYCGQVALPVPAEPLRYLENDILASCTVYDYETERKTGVYDMDLVQGKDPYDLFLSGSKALVTITNPKAETDRRLVLFRDSFGSSIAPILATGYREVVVVDIRYLPSELLAGKIDFRGSDVLFLYSTLVLNHSSTFK